MQVAAGDLERIDFLMVETVALVRMAQMTLGILAGFCCLYFGYRLFFQAIAGTNSGSFRIPGVGSVNLKVAPGIFFALIGATIIYVSLARPLSLDIGGHIIEFHLQPIELPEAPKAN
jgi:hypothetical protein